MLGLRFRLRVLRTRPVASSRRPIASGIQSASPVNGSCELVAVGLAFGAAGADADAFTASVCCGLGGLYGAYC